MDPEKNEMAEQPETEKPEGNVTPEEQKMYDGVMVAARKVLFGDAEDDTRFKMVLQRLAAAKQGNELPQAIGSMAAVVMANIQGAAEKKGREIPGDVLFHAGDEVVDDIINIAVAGKLIDERQRMDVKPQALFEGLKAFGEDEMRQGKLTPDKQAAAKQELPEIERTARAMLGSEAPAEPAKGIIDSRRA
jgi:hypothetical protein